MLIGSRRKLSQVKSDPDLHIGSEGISRVPSTKALGVLIDENIAMGIIILIMWPKKPLKELAC